MPLPILSVLGWAKTLAGGLMKPLSDWRVLAVLALAGVVVWLAVGKGSETRRADAALARAVAAERDLKEARGALAQQKVHSAALEAARASEHAEAVTDATDAAQACQARVDAARRSASAITHMLNEPPHANPDPAEPELFTAGQLRAALGR